MSLTAEMKCLLLFLLACPSAVALQGQYTVLGRVARPDDSPATRTTVRISGQTGFERQILTDDMGRFEIKDLPRGRYFLTASDPSAPDQVADPVELDLGRAEVGYVSVNLFLRRRMKVVESDERKPVVTVAEEAQSVPGAARKEFERAIKLRHKKKYADSLSRFNRSIEIFPSYFQAIAERGHLRLAMGKPTEALPDFELALTFDKRYGPALRGAGLSKFQLGRYADAVENLRQASDVEPGNPTNFYFMGVAAVALNEPEIARPALNRALSLDPKGSVRAHVHLASLLIREHRPREAVAELETYLEAVPEPFDGAKLRTLLAQLRAAP